jgi:hypothetical protein
MLWQASRLATFLYRVSFLANPPKTKVRRTSEVRRT